MTAEQSRRPTSAPTPALPCMASTQRASWRTRGDNSVERNRQRSPTTCCDPFSLNRIEPTSGRSATPCWPCHSYGYRTVFVGHGQLLRGKFGHDDWTVVGDYNFYLNARRRWGGHLRCLTAGNAPLCEVANTADSQSHPRSFINRERAAAAQRRGRVLGGHDGAVCVLTED